MRVASAHSNRTPQHSPLLSIDDVYKLAERTRMRTTLEARHLVLAQNQKMVRRDCGMSRPETRGILSHRHSLGGLDEAVSPSGHVTDRERHSKTGGEGENTGAEDTVPTAPLRPPPGFVSNVEISFKPRIPAINSYNSFVTTYGDDNEHRRRFAFNRSATVATSVMSSADGGDDTARSEEDRGQKITSPCQCQDITGPGVCLNCRKLRQHSLAKERLQMTFPPLNILEKNVTSSALVRRARPDMTPTEIQDKLISGEIARKALIFPRHRRGDRNDKNDDNTNDDNEEEEEAEKEKQIDDNRPAQHENVNTPRLCDDTDTKEPHSPEKPPDQMAPSPSKEGRRSANSLTLLARLKLQFGSGEATTPLYFMDLKHMNSKIFHGRTGRSMKVQGLKSLDEEKKKRRIVRSDSQPLWPAFVSPRKCKLIEEPSFRAYYDPPLLAKQKQISNPAFFAGSRDPYRLPERLPEVLEFAGGKMAITDPNTLISDSSPLTSSETGPAGSTDTTVPAGSTDTTVPAGSTDNIVPAGSTDTTVPVGSTDTTAPAGSTDNIVPAGSTDTTVPAGSSDTAVPAGSTDTTVPAGSTDTTVPAGSTDTTVPAGSTDTTVPAGSTDTTVPAGSTDTTVPAGSTDTTATDASTVSVAIDTATSATAVATDAVASTVDVTVASATCDTDASNVDVTVASSTGDTVASTSVVSIASANITVHDDDRANCVEVDAVTAADATVDTTTLCTSAVAGVAGSTTDGVPTSSASTAVTPVVVDGHDGVKQASREDDDDVTLTQRENNVDI